jgi:hypothetical protein
LRTLTLSADLDQDRFARALRALSPTAMVLSGHTAELDTLGRLVYAARRHAPGVEVLDYRGALPDTGASTVTRLGDTPLTARDILLDRLAGRRPGSVQDELHALLQAR